jgi:hypothetical protein
VAGVAALWLGHHGLAARPTGTNRAGIPAAFRRLLTSTGCCRPDPWDTHAYGCGIINAHALVQADLPALATPAGPRPTAAPTAAWTPSRLAALFPTLTPATVEAGLANLLRADPSTLPQALERYGPELNWLFSVHDEVRRAFAALSAPDRRTGRDHAEARRMLVVTLAELASSTLLHAITG